MGNYRVFVVDFKLNLLFSSRIISIVQPDIRRFISNQPKAVENYLEKGESLFKICKIEEKL